MQMLLSLQYLIMYGRLGRSEALLKSCPLSFSDSDLSYSCPSQKSLCVGADWGDKVYVC